jgi:glutathione S-transferase
MEKVKLHTCGNLWIKGAHPCHRVRKALDEAGVPYERVDEPTLRPMRSDLEARTGQRKLPVIEFADGRIYREESKEMAARIAAGKLFEA